jgi:hypothetical protein
MVRNMFHPAVELSSSEMTNQNHSLTHYRIIRFAQNGLISLWMERSKLEYKRHQLAESYTGKKVCKGGIDYA